MFTALLFDNEKKEYYAIIDGEYRVIPVDNWVELPFRVKENDFPSFLRIKRKSDEDMAYLFRVEHRGNEIRLMKVPDQEFYEMVRKGKIYNLKFADLRNADLHNANLHNAAMIYTNLAGANLYMADLPRADLTGANLTGADLRNADLREAILTDANLDGTKFQFAAMYNCVMPDEENK